jgi:ubiquinone/menaquinone biosynthesis C-methylase UbiE
MCAKDNISELFIEKITNHLYKYYWQELGLRDWKNRIRVRIDEVAREENTLRVIESFMGNLLDKKVLVIGSGWGGACVAAKNLGAKEVLGIDIDEEANEIANLRMQLQGHDHCCFTGAAEYLPYADNSFDYVHCFAVLEHVADIRQSLSEMIRVSRRGGHVFIQAPNYLRPIEKHYKIPFVPLMPKKLARVYLRLLKRPPDFIRSINYVWPGQVKKILCEMSNIEVEEIADEYKRRSSSHASYEQDYGCCGPELMPPQADVAVPLHRKALAVLISSFYTVWDFVFRTREIYLLVEKR